MRRLRFFLVLAVAAAGLSLPATAMSTAATATAATATAAAVTTGPPLLPDLAMAPLRDFQIDTSTGPRLLRFSAEIVNVGTGPFELRGRRASTSVPTMTVRQRVANADRTKTWRRTPASMFYAGDGHNHWHVKDLERYTITPVSSDTELARSAKTGFCFSDNAGFRTTLAGAPTSPVYRSCGVPDSTTVTMGLSVGWGDFYLWNLAWQWIDVSGLPAGDYVVRARADPQAMFSEADTTNNMTWTKIRIATTNAVTVLEQGPSA
jgi:hypothetical protein